MAGSSGSATSVAQGKLISLGSTMDDEDGREDGDTQNWDPPLVFKNIEDSSNLGHENLNVELEKTAEDKVVKT